jgi:RNA-directed DNA polymerase
MRLPRHLIESRWFVFDCEEDLLYALGAQINEAEKKDIIRLSHMGLPPITSREVLGAMLGVSAGFVWWLENYPHKQYREFDIKKGKGLRTIFAPKVALKIIQKWLSVQLQHVYQPPDHVYGFVPGRSHIEAAKIHCGANWVLSNDITDFFASTPEEKVLNSLVRLGFPKNSAKIVSSLCCLKNGLAQGSPASPVLSNIVMQDLDTRLAQIAQSYECILTRYADDIVFSGRDAFNSSIEDELKDALLKTPWTLSQDKRHFSRAPARLKVHGLLVHGENPRLTKGYRNKIRAYKHVAQHKALNDEDARRLGGHLQYSSQVDALRAVASR